MVHEGKGTGGFQAHLALETNPPFRLIPHWIILPVATIAGNGYDVAIRSMLLSPACWGVPEYPKFNFIQRGRRFGHPAPLDMFGSATYLTQSLQRVTRPVCVS